MKASEKKTAPQRELFKQTENKALLFNPEELLTAELVGRQVRNALSGMSTHECYGMKATLQPTTAELEYLLKSKASEAYHDNERPNWKLSTLISVSQKYSAVKIVGSHSYNRTIGLPRSRSLLVLYNKLTMQPLTIFDGSAISTRRTGSYASIALRIVKPDIEKANVFIIGAGEVAQAIVDDLNFWSKDKIDTVYVLSRSIETAKKFVQKNTHTTFNTIAVQNRQMMPTCDFVITASNASAPCYAFSDVKNDALILHLGGDETPKDVIEHVLLQGEVICDDIHCVSTRGSQSLPRFFIDKNETLINQAATFSIKNLYSPATRKRTSPSHMTLVTCVGLPVLDLYVAQYLYEQYILKVKEH